MKSGFIRALEFDLGPQQAARQVVRLGGVRMRKAGRVAAGADGGGEDAVVGELFTSDVAPFSILFAMSSNRLGKPRSPYKSNGPRIDRNSDA